jgi:hypothetical protein
VQDPTLAALAGAGIGLLAVCLLALCVIAVVSRTRKHKSGRGEAVEDMAADSRLATGTPYLTTV